MTDKFFSFLGLCAKAGKLTYGSELCERSIRDGKALLTIIAGDASDNTKKRFKDKCNFYGIDYLILGNKDILGKYTGKKERTVVVVTDNNFKSKLTELGKTETNLMEVGIHGEN